MLRQYNRYALYYAPPHGSRLARLGAQWLGRDAETGEVFGPPAAAPALARAHAELTASPRRYGLHGTLKPPMRLAAGRSPSALIREAGTLAESCRPIALGRLRVARIGRFLALVPEAQPSALTAFGAAVVEALDGFRAPATEAESERRRAAGLTARQEALLARWGYPYVMEEMRFHITLSGPLDDAEIAPAKAAAEAHLAPALAQAHAVTTLAVFGEDDDGVFHLVRHLPLRG